MAEEVGFNDRNSRARGWHGGRHGVRWNMKLSLGVRAPGP